MLIWQNGWREETHEDIRARGLHIHLDVQLAAWLAKVDRKMVRITDGHRGPLRDAFQVAVNEWTLPYDPGNRQSVAACDWTVFEPQHVISLSTEGLTQKSLLRCIKRDVSCPGCLVLVDAILECT